MTYLELENEYERLKSENKLLRKILQESAKQVDRLMQTWYENYISELSKLNIEIGESYVEKTK